MNRSPLPCGFASIDAPPPRLGQVSANARLSSNQPNPKELIAAKFTGDSDAANGAPKATRAHRVEDELLDFVDEDDHVIGSQKRGIIHARRLRHRAVHILVFNAAGKIFLQRRAKTKDTFPDRWDSSCSGHVDAGEHYLQSALRELGEELGLYGIGPEALELLFKINCCEQTGQEFVHVYRTGHQGPFVLPPAEISRGEFFETKEVSRQICEEPQQFAPAFIYLWQKLQSAGGLEPRG